MITDAQICGLDIYNSDGKHSISVGISPEMTITIQRHDGPGIFTMSIDEARAVAKALKCLVTEPDLD